MISVPRFLKFYSAIRSRQFRKMNPRSFAYARRMHDPPVPNSYMRFIGEDDAARKLLNLAPAFLKTLSWSCRVINMAALSFNKFSTSPLSNLSINSENTRMSSRVLLLHKSQNVSTPQYCTLPDLFCLASRSCKASLLKLYGVLPSIFSNDTSCPEKVSSRVTRRLPVSPAAPGLPSRPARHRLRQRGRRSQLEYHGGADGWRRPPGWATPPPRSSSWNS